mgnify:FL=1
MITYHAMPLKLKSAKPPPCAEALVRWYVEKYSSRLSLLTLEIYFAYFRDRLSESLIAEKLGTTIGSVRSSVNRLRKDARTEERRVYNVEMSALVS